jgi:hypothetical protein
MKKSVFRIIIVTFVLIVFLLIGKQLHENNYIQSMFNDNNNYVNEQSSIFNLDVDSYYKTNVELYANNEAAENGADDPEFTIKANESVLLLQLEGEFAKVKYNDTFGWIPAWYLSDEAQDINFPPPFLLLAKEKANLSLYPLGNIAYDRNYYLQEGKIVKVMAEFNAWYLVDFLRYDNPEYDLLWINKDKTIAYDVTKAKEGYLKEGATLYSKEGVITDEIIEGYVIITSKENDLYKVNGAGGQNGYVKKSDFEYFSFDTFSNFLSP